MGRLPWFLSFAWAVKNTYCSYQPAQAEWHVLIPPRCDFLVDYSILVEPLLGVRPWISMCALEHSAKQVIGPDAINCTKRDEEGRFARSTSSGRSR